MLRKYLTVALLIFIVPFVHLSHADIRQLSEVRKIPNNAFVVSDYADQLIIKFKPVFSATNIGTVSAQRMSSMSATTALDLQYKRALPNKSHVLKLPYEMDIDSAKIYARELGKRFDVEYAEVDRRVYPLATTPNDTDYGFFQGYLHQPSASLISAINMPLAWDQTKGNSNIIIGVIDSGILLTHEDLNGRIILPGYDFVSDIAQAGDGDGRDGDPSDVDGNSVWHGTLVAGVIGAESNNSQGITGVDWNARILPIRALGVDIGSTSDIIDAVYWAIGDTVSGVPVNANPVNVLNMSLGGNGVCSQGQQDAINAAVTKGVTVVVAAGNENKDASLVSPANCNNVITIAALNVDGSRASFSNFGSNVDIAAPGVNMFSTYGPNTNSYAYVGGTSFSAPLVSGVVSLMLANNLNFTNGNIPLPEVPSVIESSLKSSIRAFPTGTGSDCTTSLCGTGMLDANLAVSSVVGLSSTTDSDNDGVPNYEDSSPNNAQIASVFSKARAGELVGINAGLSLSGVDMLSEAAFGTIGKPSSSNFTFADGVLQYTVTGVAGGTAQITLTYPSIPSGAKFYKVSSAGVWTEVTDTTVDCSVAVVGNTITLTITDNGACDTNAASGTISDPFGVAVPVVSTSQSGSGGGGGGSLDYLFLLFLASLLVFRQRAIVLRFYKKRLRIS